MFSKRTAPRLRSILGRPAQTPKKSSRRFSPRVESLEARQMLDGGGFLQGTSFIDLDNDNTLDIDESYKPGATIFLDLDNDSVLDFTDLNSNNAWDAGEGERWTLTDINGAYLFDELDPGTYRIVEIPTAGYANSGTQINTNIHHTAFQVAPNTIQAEVHDPNSVYVNYHGVQLFEGINFQYFGTAMSSPYGTLSVSLGTTPGSQDISSPFITFCIDVEHALPFAGGAQFQVLPGPASENLQNNGGRIAYLYNHYATTPLTSVTAAGLSIAIRELQYDAVPDLNSGNFYPTSRVSSFTSAAEYAGVIASAESFIALSEGKSEEAVVLDATLGGQPVPLTGRQGVLANGSLNFANIPSTPELPEPELFITITPDATNRVGDPHKFIVTVMQDDGLDADEGGDGVTGFTPSAGNVVDVLLTDELGATNVELDNTCDDGTLADGTCYIEFTSPTTGQVIGNAFVTKTFDYGELGQVTLERDTNPTTVDIEAGPGGSGPAIKKFVDAKISIEADGVNRVGAPHTFTVTVLQDAGDGLGFVPAAGETVTPSELGIGDVIGGTCTTDPTDVLGQCTIIVNSSATGVSVVGAASTVEVGGIEIDVATNGLGLNSGPATKRWVDAKISIEADGVNRVGAPHTFTVTVLQDAGDGLGFVPAAGETVTPSELGIGDVIGGTCTTDPTDALGQCTIIVNSSATGISVVGAASTVEVGGIEIDVATNGLGLNSGPATKRWVDAKISIEADGVNRVGAPHTFTVTVLEDVGDGLGFVPAAGETVTPSELGIGDVIGGTCTTDPTDALGQCTIIVNSSATGISVVGAASTVEVGGIEIDVATNGLGLNSGPATKRWVDAKISIEADGVNRVGAPHTFTVTVLQDAGDGLGFVPAAGETVTPSELGIGDVIGGTCTTDPTDVLGQCTIIVNSSATGVSVVGAASTVEVGGIEIDVATNGLGLNSGPATKRWVDAKISIEADGVNRVGAPHTFTVTVLQDAGDGLGFVPAAGETVTPSELGIGDVIGGTCTTDPTDVLGQCTIIVNSSATGISVVGAASTVEVGGIEIDVATNGLGLNSGPATKRWVDAKISIAADGVNRVGDPHTFTVTVMEDAGDGLGFVVAAGETVSLVEVGVGSITGGTCTTDPTNVLGQCTVIVNSAVAGVSTVTASSNVAVAGISVPVATDGTGLNSAPGKKTWVQPGIDIEKTTNGPSNSNSIAPDYDNEDAPNGPGVPILTPGTTVTWTYKVTNTGQLPYQQSEIAIVDDNGTPANSADDFSIANGRITFLSVQTGDADNILEPGEVWLYQASDTVQTLPSGGPIGSPIVFNFEGNSALDGTDGNIRSFSSGGVAVKASAFSRTADSAGTWADAWLGAYGGGLGVTDSIEGSGGSDMHTVDNAGQYNFVLLRFDQPVVIDAAFLGYVVGDSDLNLWVGNVAGAYANDAINLSDALLATFGSPEASLTGSSSTRTANLNSGNLSGNFVVIAAAVLGTTDSTIDRFKLETVTIQKTGQGGCYENKAVVTAPGGTDSDLSHYCNPSTPPEPGIDIEKTTNGPSNTNPTAPNYDNEDAANGAGVPVLAPGTSVTWTYKVTNTGNVPYTTSQITIVDDNGTPSSTGDDMSIANGKITFQSVQTGDADNILEPGEVWLYQATGVVQTLATSTGSTITFNMAGSSSTSGTAGNIRTFTSGGASVRASAFSRDVSGNWSTAYLGSYSGGLGVTDGSEGSGGSNEHTVDNVGRDNYVLFEFSQNVIVDSAFLGYVVNDSDLRIWIGTKTDPFNNHLTLSDSMLTNLGFTEVNLTDLTGTRTADFNSGSRVGNVVVIAAQDDDDTPEDRFKIQTMKVKTVVSTCYENKAVVTVPGDDDSDLSHYCNPTAPPPPSTGSLSGHKYRDKTGNGASTDDKSAPLSGVTMYVDYDSDGVLDSNEPRDVTDTDGYFQITGLSPGSYKVREVVPTNFIRTGPTLVDYQTVTVIAGQNSAVNTSGAKNEFYNFQKCDASSITQITYKLNGSTTVTDLSGNVQQGDQVTVKFYATRSVEASLVSYTAPDPFFDANRASMQEVFDSATGTFAAGWQTMTVDVPDSYFQIDFVCGAVIDVLGPAGSNIFYTPQGRLIDAHNGGTNAPIANASSLAGFVYVDANNNGIKESSEAGIGGVTVKLWNSAGTTVIRTETSRPDGSYIFSNLPAATYQIRESQPGSYNDGIDKIGSQGGTMANDKLTVNLGANVHGTANNFGERAKSYSAGSVVVTANKSAQTPVVQQAAARRRVSEERVVAESVAQTITSSVSQNNRVRRSAMTASAVDAVLEGTIAVRRIGR